jgi:hypothetical protein
MDRRCRFRGLAAVPVLVAVLALSGCSATAPDPSIARAAATAKAVPSFPIGSRLVGMDSREVEGLLGSPVMLRREQPAQYWRYSHDGCAIDMFLYADPETGTWRVAHVAVRPDGARAPLSNPRCAQMQASLGSGAAAPALPLVESH